MSFSATCKTCLQIDEELCYVNFWSMWIRYIGLLEMHPGRRRKRLRLNVRQLLLVIFRSRNGFKATWTKNIAQVLKSHDCDLTIAGCLGGITVLVEAVGGQQ